MLTKMPGHLKINFFYGDGTLTPAKLPGNPFCCNHSRPPPRTIELKFDSVTFSLTHTIQYLYEMFCVYSPLVINLKQTPHILVLATHR